MKRAALIITASWNQSSAKALNLQMNPMENVMKNTRITILAVLAAAALAACQTVEGAGRDIQTAGEVITDTSQDARR